MNLLFVHQGVKYPIRWNGDVGIPLGMLYLAGFLKEHNKDVDVTLRDYRLHGEATLEDDIAKADIVAAGSSTADFSGALRLLTHAKEQGKTTVMGGILPTLVPDDVLQKGVDIVVRGEGEKTLSELLTQGSPERVLGVSYTKGGEIIHNGRRPQLKAEEIVMPDYDLVDLREYLGKSTAPMYSSRGCPMRCSYCSLNTFWRYSYRHEDVDQVLAEIETLAELGFKDIRFKDDDFLIGGKRKDALLAAMASLDIEAKFKAKGRIDAVTPEMLESLQRAGFNKMYFGVEAFDAGHLQVIQKGYRGSFDDQLRMVVESGMYVELGFILGVQGETEGTLRRKAERIIALGQDSHVIPRITFLTPYPGTELAEDPVGLRFLTDDWDNYNSIRPVCVPESLGANALDLLVEVHTQIAEETGTVNYNPLLGPGYVEMLKKRMVA